MRVEIQRGCIHPEHGGKGDKVLYSRDGQTVFVISIPPGQKWSLPGLGTAWGVLVA